MAIVEAQTQIHAHRHTSAEALDEAYDRRTLIPRRHAVDDPHGPVRCIPFTFQHKGFTAVAAPGCDTTGGRGQTPSPGILVAEEGGKTRRVVESRKTQPIDGAVAANQRRGVQVT